MRVMPLKMLKRNLSRIYKLFKDLYQDQYTMDVFLWYDKELDPNIDKKFYECIIENGFNIYILINTFLDKGHHKKSEELIKFSAEIKKEDELGLFTVIGKFIGMIYLFLKALILNILCFGYCCKKKTIETTTNEDEKNKKEELKNLKEALRFFKKNTAQIDIIRNDKLERLYFPLMPFCQNLSEKEQKKFHVSVDRT